METLPFVSTGDKIINQTCFDFMLDIAFVHGFSAIPKWVKRFDKTCSNIFLENQLPSRPIRWRQEVNSNI